MLKGFRDFILRGNVVALAVAVVIGGAFTALVAVFGESIITPLLAVFGGPGSRLKPACWRIRPTA